MLNTHVNQWKNATIVIDGLKMLLIKNSAASSSSMWKTFTMDFIKLIQ